MPLVLKENISRNSTLAIWKINESLQVLQDMVKITQEEQDAIKTISNIEKQKQWFAARVLFQKIFNNQGLEIVYDKYGKPSIKNSTQKISISHSKDYVAIITDQEEVGIDIEKIDAKIESIAERFLNENEYGRIGSENRTELQYLHWCAKETLYKVYGKKQLSFKNNILIEPFSYRKEGGVILGEIVTSSFKKKYHLKYTKINDYMLVYVFNN